MLSETLSEGLAPYRIGAKLRRLRLKRGMGLAELSAQSGLSAGMLSRIERDLLVPTLPTLMRVAMVFGVGLEHFFAPPGEGPLCEITRAGERLALPEPGAGPRAAYSFESLTYPVTERRMEAFLAHFTEGAPGSRAHHHAGTELIYVIAGGLELTHDGQAHRLGPGDAVQFDASVPHSYRADPAAEVLIAVQP